MTTRLATSRDKKQIFKLVDEFSVLLGAKDIPSKVGGVVFDEIINRNDIKIFVAEESNELIGVATFYLLPDIRHGWHRGHIENFFVTKNMRDQGAGTAIFEAIKDYCRKNNIKVIKLASGNELASAHKFYEENGGKTTERFFRFDI
ncbi:MAG: GNAT family N-acetyltransferase [Candidatus Wildermuthbacteria bacterium]|nr:GNAT family N-acetyltransferase [Candidatus Wildermuthbacteria bacterium]